MEKIIVIGGKGTPIVVAEQIHDANIRFGSKYEFIGFAYDEETKDNTINGFPILGGTREIFKLYERYNDVKFVFMMYRQDVYKERVELQQSLKIPDSRYFTFVHPSVMLAQSVKVGVGCVILANCVINSNATLGRFCTMQSNSMIGHEATIGDYNFIAAHAIVANINMGSRNFIGINASTNNFISIGDDCFIGMGSNVIKDVPSNTKVYGNPAKPFFTNLKPF